VLGLGLIPNSAGGWIARLLMIAGGVLFAAPVPRLTGLSFATNLALAAAFVVAGLLVLFVLVRKSEQGRTSP
jgi:hypothetical protein